MLKLPLAKPRQPQKQSTSKKPAPGFRPDLRQDRNVAELDAPKFFKISVEPGEESRSAQLRPSAIEALVQGKGENKNKTWWFPRNNEKKSTKSVHPKPVLLDVHYAIISHWWASSFPGVAKTPQEQITRDRELYQALKMRFEGGLPK